jgi:hypothetical protein
MRRVAIPDRDTDKARYYGGHSLTERDTAVEPDAAGRATRLQYD